MALVYCQKCGHQIDDSNSFCPSCGHSLNNEEVKTKEFCSNCGNELQPDQTFCTKCGCAKGQVKTISIVSSTLKNIDETRSTSKLTELLHTIFKFSGLGLYLLGIICLLFIPNSLNISIFDEIFVRIELLSSVSFEKADAIFVAMNSFMFIVFTLIIVLMNISTVIGLFKINEIKRKKLWKTFVNLITNVFMLSWYSSSVNKSLGPVFGVQLYLVITILIYIMYIILYIIKLIKGEYGTYSFKSKRTGKILASRILHISAIIVIFFAYSFLCGSSFYLKEFGFKFFKGLSSLDNRNMFNIFTNLNLDNPVSFISSTLDYIMIYFGLLFETVLIAGFAMGVYRLIVSDENDEALVGSFYGILGRPIITGFVMLTIFQYDIFPLIGGNELPEVLLDSISKSYLYGFISYFVVLLIIIGFSIANAVVQNKWLKENNYK